MANCDCLTAGTYIFSAQAGKLVSVDNNAIPVYFAVDGDARMFHDLNAIVTSVGYNGQVGYQFMHAMRAFVYVYVFTERVGEIVINGLAFPAVCADGDFGGDPPACVVGDSGLERVITWYECNRLTTRSTPVTINMGQNVAYKAFLVGMRAEIANAETRIAQFSFRFNFIPNISDADDYCFPINTDTCPKPPCHYNDALEFKDDLEGELNEVEEH